MSTELTRRSSGEVAAPELTVEELLEQVQKIQQVMNKVMKNGTHYGTIPGTDKPTLFKPGAEKLCLLFRLDPEYESETIWQGEHMTVKTTCRLFHSPSGTRVASGEGMCSTKETKYGVRLQKRSCPICGVEAIIKGKQEYGGGWLCFKRQGGCGAKFGDGDAAIEGQTVGKITNPDLPDTYNTVLKMANKRALVAAVLNGTAASDIFTQDLEDTVVAAKEPEPVSLATVTLLLDTITVLAAYAPEYWKEEVVIKNATQRFGRSINQLSELTEEQAKTIIDGALKWATDNPPPEDKSDFGEQADAEPAEYVEAEVVGSEDK
jgi:hypothetical protein